MTSPKTYPPFEACGQYTDAPIRVVWQSRRRKVLVCFVRQTDDGNPYVVPAFWVDSVRRCDCGRGEHYRVKSNGQDYQVGPGGQPFGACQ